MTTDWAAEARRALAGARPEAAELLASCTGSGYGAVLFRRTPPGADLRRVVYVAVPDDADAPVVEGSDAWDTRLGPGNGASAQEPAVCWSGYEAGETCSGSVTVVWGKASGPVASVGVAGDAHACALGADGAFVVAHVSVTAWFDEPNGSLRIVGWSRAREEIATAMIPARLF